MSALRAPTGSTTARLQLIVQMRVQIDWCVTLPSTAQNNSKRTAENGATKKKGQNRSEAWHAIVRRCDQRNLSSKNSAFAALISNISERHRAKDVEQFDDILRTFINETNKVQNRFGTIRDEEKCSQSRN